MPNKMVGRAYTSVALIISTMKCLCLGIRDIIRPETTLNTITGTIFNGASIMALEKKINTKDTTPSISATPKRQLIRKKTMALVIMREKKKGQSMAVYDLLSASVSPLSAYPTMSMAWPSVPESITIPWPGAISEYDQPHSACEACRTRATATAARKAEDLK
jgi:hypothetical protein